MSSNKSTLSVSDCTSHDGRGGDILKMGYLKKLKTMKKKFFVLRGESSEASARLEYYDSEKKWKSHHSPKRSISLKTCFNINRRLDTKQKHVIALYTKDDCFCVVLETEEEVEDWLRALLNLQHGEETTNGEKPRPTFEHVWRVTVQKKGLGSMKNILGAYHLCLTDKTLSLVKKGSNESKNESFEFSLMSIRRCGHSDCFFYMEVGRLACTGAGDLWMLTEDPNIAENMHAAILHAMSNNNSNKLSNTPNSNITKEEPKENKRTRSNSAVNMNRWQNHPNTSKASYTAEDGSRLVSTRSSGLAISETSSSISTTDNLITQIRDRSDSMPSRARTTSEGHSSASQQVRNIHLIPGHMASRPYSMYSPGISYTPVGSSPVSPASGACSTDSAGSSLSMDDAECWAEATSEATFLSRYLHPLTPDEPVILEEEYTPWENNPDDEKVISDELVDSFSQPIQTASSTQRAQRPSKCIANNSYKSNSPIQNSYMDMYSPCGSSPMDQGSSYLPMSPGDVGGHSHASSLNEEGYVPMGPSTTDDGYVDMHPNPRTGSMNSEISPGSSCSLTSGTPSTDMRFSEFHLEKVTSYFPPCELEGRHPRAYSVGSRPENKQLRKELINTSGESCRVRAFSVGSRIPPGLRLSWVPQLSQHCPTPNAATSAPHLSSSWSGVTPNTKYQTSTDLMEMDFSRNSLRSNKSTSKKRSSERLSISAVTTTAISTSNSSISTSTASPSTAEGTLEMIFSQKEQQLTNKTQDLTLNIKSGPYVEMKAIDIRNSPPTKIWPNRSPKIQVPYVDMSISRAPPIKFPHTTSISLENDYVEMNEYITDAHSEEKTHENYIEMSIKPEIHFSIDTQKVENPPENYVEMNSKKSGDDYANSSQEDKIRNNWKEKNRHTSQPIAIQTPCLGISSSRGRKRSTGTPPKPPPSFLALGANNGSPGSSPLNSFRHKSRENTLDANTPSSTTGIIFPFSLNSPGSPVKAFVGFDGARKCPVDATNGTVRISYLSSECSSPVSNHETPDSSSSSELPTPVNSETIGEIADLTSFGVGCDYVNCNPIQENKLDGDYTFMKPLKIPSKKSNSFELSKSDFKYSNNIHKDLMSMTLSPDSMSTSIVPQTITSYSNSQLSIPKFVKPILCTNNLLSNRTSDCVSKSSIIDSTLTSPTQSILDVIVSPNELSKSITPSIQSKNSHESKEEKFNEIFKNTNNSDSIDSPNKSSGINLVNTNISNSNKVNSSLEMSFTNHSKYTCSFISNENKKLISDPQKQISSSEGDQELNSIGQNDPCFSQTINNKLKVNKIAELKKSNSGNLIPTTLGNTNLKDQSSIFLTNSESHSSIINNSESQNLTIQKLPSIDDQTECDYKMWNIQKDKELHYASLDLSEEGRESNCISTPVSEDSFTYAQIDFGKSEGLRTISSSLNRKMLH